MHASCRWEGEDLRLALHVQPRASRDEFVGMYGERLKLRITAPPVDGKANAHLIAFLAKACGVPKGDVALLRGETGREKDFLIRAPRRLPDAIRALLATIP